MWHDVLENNYFLKKLYKKVPELNKVNIFEINIKNEGNKISINFDLPYYADFPPQKWVNLNYNKIIVKVDFFLIHELYFKATAYDFLKGDIKIFVDENQLINLEILGFFNAKIIANSGLIQEVIAYKYEPSLANQ